MHTCESPHSYVNPILFCRLEILQDQRCNPKGIKETEQHYDVIGILYSFFLMTDTQCTL